MTITTLSSQDVDHDIGLARKAASDGPVFITDHGIPVHVLMTIEEYRKLTGGGKNLIDLLSMPEGAGDIDFEPPRMRGPILRPADFS